MDDNRGLWRGKRLDNGELVFGDLLQIPRLGKNGEIDGTIPAIMERTPEAGCYYVDIQTLGECTGLRDKNKNLIFEKDIIEHKCGDRKTVFYDSVLACFGIYCGETFFPLYKLKLSANEIIGNIHDNPELMKGEEP